MAVFNLSVYDKTKQTGVDTNNDEPERYDDIVDENCKNGEDNRKTDRQDDIDLKVMYSKMEKVNTTKCGVDSD